MKTPEEIKKGLECCSIEYRCPTDCRDCPYVDIKPLCIGQIFREVLTYIRQLEAQVETLKKDVQRGRGEL